MYSEAQLLPLFQQAVEQARELEIAHANRRVEAEADLWKEQIAGAYAAAAFGALERAIEVASDDDSRRDEVNEFLEQARTELANARKLLEAAEKINTGMRSKAISAAILACRAETNNHAA